MGTIRIRLPGTSKVVYTTRSTVGIPGSLVPGRGCDILVPARDSLRGATVVPSLRAACWLTSRRSSTGGGSLFTQQGLGVTSGPCGRCTAALPGGRCSTAPLSRTDIGCARRCFSLQASGAGDRQSWLGAPHGIGASGGARASSGGGSRHPRQEGTATIGGSRRSC